MTWVTKFFYCYRKTYKCNCSILQVIQQYHYTLFVIKREDACRIQNLLNNLDPNLRSIVNLFQNEVLHFLDLELSPENISIFGKNANAGLYTNFIIYVLWIHPSAWIKSLISHAWRICFQNKLSSQINVVKTITSWSDFPRYIVKSIIDQMRNTTDKIADKAK